MGYEMHKNGLLIGSTMEKKIWLRAMRRFVTFLIGLVVAFSFLGCNLNLGSGGDQSGEVTSHVLEDSTANDAFDVDGTATAPDACPDDPNKTTPGECGCGIQEGSCHVACSDTPGFVDSQNYTCSLWSGYDCTRASEQWGYSEFQEWDLITHCPESCGFCPDGDACPDDPQKTLPGSCGCGNTDEDSDGDGTADCRDYCPADKHKTQPGICGCGIEEGSCPKPKLARWTFLVFMNGDNDLESFVPHDINELEQVGSGDGVHVVVQADRIAGYSSEDGDWTTTRRYYITHDDNTEQVTSKFIEDLDELDMGDPKVLEDFLMWAHQNFPAERMALVLWNHGEGWRSRPRPVQRGVSFDETSGSELSIANGELAASLEKIVAARGPLDLIAFDACLMGGWEVAHALSGLALNMAASEALVAAEGYLYADALALLRNSTAEIDGSTLANQMARIAVNQAGEKTHAAIDLTSLAALNQAIDNLADEVMADSSLRQPLLEARDQSRGTNSDNRTQYLDLKDFANALTRSNDSRLHAPGRALLTGINTAVIGAYGNDFYDWVGGLTIMMNYEIDPSTLAEYSLGTWSDATAWDDLLHWLADTNP